MPSRRPFPAVLPARRPGGPGVFAVAAAAVAALAAAAVPAAAAPVTLTFDNAGGGGAVAGWSEGGYAVAFNGVHPVVGRGADACSPACPDNGSDYLLGRGGSLSITPTLSRVFALTSFDAAAPFGERYGDWAQYIDVTGVKGNGSTVSQRFALDWIEDGHDVAAGFHTFTLGPDFLELRSVSLRNGGTGAMYSLDNIRLGDASAIAVPEPGTLALIAAALLAAIGASRSKPRRAGA